MMLSRQRSSVDVHKSTFRQRVVMEWNLLPQLSEHVVDAIRLMQQRSRTILFRG